MQSQREMDRADEAQAPQPDHESGVGDDAAGRAAVVAAAISILREEALHHVTLDRVASAAGIDPATVTALYPTVDELVVDVIADWNGRRLEPMVPVAQEHGAVAFLRMIVTANIADPGLMRLLAASASIAGTPALPVSVTLQHEWIHFHALVQRALANDIAVGREPATMEPARGAEQLIALYEGLQLQSMLRPHMDLLDAYDRAVTRLRTGWSQTYTPPVWDI